MTAGRTVGARPPAGGAVVRAVRTYLDHLVVERGLADNTLKSYRRDLRRYAGWLAGAGRRRPRRRSREDDRHGVPGARCARATPTTRR